MDEDYLLISGIQHFCYCRRQWALIHIEDYWAENLLTAEGSILHRKVHDENLVTSRNGVITVRGLRVKSNTLMITGVCDAVEMIPDNSGITLQGKQGRWRVHPVEYKRGKTKELDCDRLQLAAECMCLEEMLSCSMGKGSLFYGQTRRREEVLIDDELRKSVKSMFREMWDYYRRQHTPKVKIRPSCKSCSLNNYCMPELEKKAEVSDYINKHIHEAEE